MWLFTKAEIPGDSVPLCKPIIPCFMDNGRKGEQNEQYSEIKTICSLEDKISVSLCNSAASRTIARGGLEQIMIQSTIIIRNGGKLLIAVAFPKYCICEWVSGLSFMHTCAYMYTCTHTHTQIHSLFSLVKKKH